MDNGVGLEDFKIKMTMEKCNYLNECSQDFSKDLFQKKITSSLDQNMYMFYTLYTYIYNI